MVDVDAYLARIGYEGPRAPTLDVLRALQLAHVRAVPFENLDVFARTGVQVDRTWSIPKVVERRRGGWCFELNGAFSALLDSLGFAVNLHSGRVVLGDGTIGPPLDHLVLSVRIDGRRWLVDVGFGDSALAPLDLAVAEPQDGVSARYRITGLGEGAVELSEVQSDGSWVRQLLIDLTPRQLDEFAPRSTFLQTEPGLVWTTKRFATRATHDAPAGRVWLFADRVKLRAGDGATTEAPITPDEWRAALWDHFAMRYP